MTGLSEELLVSLGLVALMIVTHMVGLLSLTRLTRVHIEHFRTPWLTLDRLLVPLTMGTGLFVLHGFEVWIYAAAYQAASVTRSWESALFLSVSSYATTGWTGFHVPQEWRVTVGLESLSGMLLMGWSTAFLFQTLHRILATEETHPLPEGAIAAEPDAEASSTSPRPNGSGAGSPVRTN